MSRTFFAPFWAKTYRCKRHIEMDKEIGAISSESVIEFNIYDSKNPTQISHGPKKIIPYRIE